MKGRSPLTKLISSYYKVTCLVAEAEAVDVVYLDFTKAFDNVSHSILMEKLTAYVLESGIKSSWWLVTSGVFQGSTEASPVKYPYQ